MTDEDKYYGKSISLLERIELHLIAISKDVKDSKDIGAIPTSEQSKKAAAKKNNSNEDTGYINALRESINLVEKASKIDTNKATSMLTFLKEFSKIVKEFDNTSALSLAGKNINSFLLNINEGLQEIDPEKVLIIGIIGANILKFSVSMLLATPGLIVAIPLLPLLGLVLRPFIATMDRIKDSEKFSDAVKVLPLMGLSILAFSGSLALSSILLAEPMSNPMRFVMLFGIMALSGLTFGVLGMFNDTINKGALSVVFMSAGLFLFSAAAKYAAENIKMNYDQLIQIPLLIGSVGLVFAIAGKFATQIMMGSLAIGLASGVLWLMSTPLQKISDVLKNDDAILWQLPVLIGGIATAFGLAGIPPIPLAIAAGAIALGLAGGALWTIAASLKNYKEINFTEKDGESVKFGINSVIGGFAGALDGMSLSTMVKLPLLIPMVGLMGLSLWGLSKGLSAYKNNAGDWSIRDTQNLETTIIGLTGAFAIAGSEEGMSQLFGVSVGKNAVQRGIDSTRKMGNNLKSLSDGIMAWKKMELTPKDVQMVNDNISRVLNVIPAIFATIGSANRGSSESTMFGMTFENPFKNNDVEAGISSVKNLGGTLESLSSGVLAWKTGGKNGITSALIENVKTNIGMLLGTLPSVFAELGAADRETSGIFPWSDGDIENGIELVEDLAPVMKSMADLLQAIKGEDTAALSKQFQNDIPPMITSLASALVDYANITDDIDVDDINEYLGDNIEILGSLIKVASSGIDIAEQINTEIPKMISNIPMLATTFIAFNESMDGIGNKITEPFKIIKLKEYNAEIVSVTSNIDKFIGLSDGIENLTEVLMALNKTLEEQGTLLTTNLETASQFALIETPDTALSQKVSQIDDAGVLPSTLQQNFPYPYQQDGAQDTGAQGTVGESAQGTEAQGIGGDFKQIMHQMTNMLQQQLSALISTSKNQATELSELKASILSGIRIKEDI